MEITNELFQKFLEGDQNSIAIVYKEYKNLMFFIISSFIKISTIFKVLVIGLLNAISYIVSITNRSVYSQSNVLNSFLYVFTIYK